MEELKIAIIAIQATNQTPLGAILIMDFFNKIEANNGQ